MQIFEVKGTIMQELLNNIDNAKDCKSVNRDNANKYKVKLCAVSSLHNNARNSNAITKK